LVETLLLDKRFLLYIKREQRIFFNVGKFATNKV
jgi:hypothetical protein